MRPFSHLQIRPSEAEDATALRDCLAEVADERRFILMTEAPSVERVERFIRKMQELGCPQYVAVDGETVVGWCDIRREDHPARAHGGEMGMGVRASWRRRGVGRQLLTHCLDEAWRCGLRKVELSVFEHNHGALALYLQMGFQKTGVCREYARIDGHFIDAIRMVRFSPALQEDS